MAPRRKKRVKKKVERLEQNLLLNSYMLDLFGLKSFDQLQALLRETKDGFDEEGHSYVYYALLGLKGLKLGNELETYDFNIKSYMDTINRRRARPIELKYFQYLAVLFTEIYLDRYFRDPVKLLNELNRYAVSRENNDIYFARNDLEKLAFWMATGSGKTILLHINYLQFVKYNKGSHKFDLDNILLITPNEGLSEQHLKEMHHNSIPCEKFAGALDGYFASSVAKTDIVKVLDIHKFREEKKSQGVTIDIESFGQKNLIFVDEGHKGSGGTQWKKFRKRVAEEGFTFEYSATFGQAAATAKTRKGEKHSFIEEYGKSILFDYSYRHFYNDGYGKDYRILNLKEKVYSEVTQDTLMMANLLSFYEQKLLYGERKEEFGEYNIEPPLWVFVGSTVGRKWENKAGKKGQSDILQVVRFINRVLTDGPWATEKIRRIMSGSSGLLDGKDRDLFSEEYPERKLAFLKSRGQNPGSLYRGILATVFHTAGAAPLHLVDLRKAGGEIALKAGTGEFFGVIYIGDDSQFLKLVKEREPSIPAEKDELTGSVFDMIKDDESRINLLIGAKKFIEGWDCWRVSNMGLLNIGRSEGSQIIQLFGRGVRLKGQDFSLKRSSAVGGAPPDHIRVLETLNIFGIKADYMDAFRDILEKEGIDTEVYVEKNVKIQKMEPFFERGLLIPYVNSTNYRNEEMFELVVRADDGIAAHVDIMPKVEEVTSLRQKGIRATGGNPPQTIDDRYIDLMDWDRIYFALLDHRNGKGWNNFVFSKESLKGIIREKRYELHCPKEFVRPGRFGELWRTEDVTIAILKKYLTRFYNRNRNTWNRKNMILQPLLKEHGNFEFGKYTLKVIDDAEILEKVDAALADNGRTIYEDYNEPPLTNVYFDRHFYQPLFAECGDEEPRRVRFTPVGLNEGEQNFIRDLREYCESHPGLIDGNQLYELYVLRNLPRKGVGFFKTANFFPDFILWVVRGNRQNLIFADPKGLGHAWGTGFIDEKIELSRHIKEVESRLNETGEHDVEITLDSFIISVTPFRDVKSAIGKRKQDLEEMHILFQEDGIKYIEKMLTAVVPVGDTTPSA